MIEIKRMSNVRWGVPTRRWIRWGLGRVRHPELSGYTREFPAHEVGYRRRGEQGGASSAWAWTVGSYPRALVPCLHLMSRSEQNRKESGSGEP